jgi:hypothetical protein
MNIVHNTSFIFTSNRKKTQTLLLSAFQARVLQRARGGNSFITQLPSTVTVADVE